MPSTAAAIVVNLTAIAPTARTYVAVPPTGGASGVSNVNPLPGQVVAVLVEVGIGTSEDINIYNNAGTINVAIDVAGYVDSHRRACSHRLPRPGSATRARPVAASPAISAMPFPTFSIRSEPNRSACRSLSPGPAARFRRRE